MLLDQSNKTRWLFPALKSTIVFLLHSTVSHWLDSNSKANSSCCHRSNAWSHLEQKVVSSAYIAIPQITSSGKSSIYSRKRAGPMEAWWTPALTRYSCEDFPSRTTQSHLLLWKEEIRPNIWPEISKTSICEEDQHAKPCQKPWVIKCYSSNSPRSVKNPGNSISYNCKKICSW